MFHDGSPAEDPVDLNITVDDVNDCTPVVKLHQVGTVKESSKAGIVGGNQQHSWFQSLC